MFPQLVGRISISASLFYTLAALSGSCAKAEEPPFARTECAPSADAGAASFRKEIEATDRIVRHTFPPGIEIREGTGDGNPRLKEEIWLVDDKVSPPKETRVGRIFTIPAGTKLYHWGPEPVRKWSDDGFPDNEEMKRRRAASGYYLAGDITSSMQYGPVLVAYTAKRDLLISEGMHLLEIAAAFGLKLDERQGHQQKIDETFALDGHDDQYFDEDYQWVAVYQPDEVIQPHKATIQDFYSSEKFLSGKMKLGQIVAIDGSYPFAPTPALKRIYPAIYALVSGEPLTQKEEQWLLSEFSSEATHAGNFMRDWRTFGTGKIRTSLQQRLAAKLPAAITQAVKSSWGDFPTLESIPPAVKEMANAFGIPLEKLLTPVASQKK